MLSAELATSLGDKSLAFARSIGEQWHDTEKFDAEACQRRFLYTQSYAAAHTAFSYWILRKCERHYDCNVLARNLVERIFNSRVAVKSPKHAVELMVYELSERIRRLELLHSEHKTVPNEAVDSKDRLKVELEEFLRLLGTRTIPQWEFFRKAKEAKIASWAYRGVYAELSCYAHAGFEMSKPQELNRAWRFSDFVALLAPIDTAVALHSLSCTDDSCQIGPDYKALVREFSDKALGGQMPENT